MQSGRIFAVVLGAGQSRRFDENKLLTEFEGDSLVHRAVVAARQAVGANVLLVAGRGARDVIDTCGNDVRYIAVNDRFEQGIGTSIACAARSLQHVAEALLVTLADQPLVTATHLRAIIDAWSGDERAIVATAFSGAKGPPVLLPASTFPELLGLKADSGARHLFADPSYELTTVWLDAAGVDIDTRGDLEKIS